MLTRARLAWSALVSGYWFIPGLIVVMASGLALGLIELDTWLESDGSRVGFTGGPASARELLSSIASSTLTLAALVFSVTIVALQLASGQFSPRVLRTFLQDRRNQATLGVFLATFVHALIVLREVRGDDGAVAKFVPGISVAVSFALVVLSVAFFVQYIHNITTSIRVIEIIDRISKETAGTIERVHPGEPRPADVGGPASAPAGKLCAEGRGVVTSVALDRLRRVAVRADVCLVVVPRIGHFVARGMPLAIVHGDGDVLSAHDEAELRKAFTLAKERDLAEDAEFGFRQLVDIAERALSPGVNDPTTATQCLDHLHDLLRRLAHRPLPPCATETVEGTVRVVMPRPTWDDYVSLAVDEIRHWGAGSIQVHKRIGSMLDDLAGAVGPERAAVIAERRRLLEARGDDLPAPERPSVAETRS